MASLKYIWLGLVLAIVFVTTLWPSFDIVTAAYFYDGTQFPARAHIINILLHDVATGWPPKILFGILVLGLLINCRPGRAWRTWMFLLACLVLGPGLIANVLCKDLWGRARPAQIQEFGGKADFTPYWLRSNQCAKNCSFVNGDGSLGFITAASGLVLVRRRRLLFWSGTGFGSILGINRILMGSHFLSDTVWAALLMLMTMLALHVLFYGRAKTAEVWRAL